jgi:hypothetical protein
MRRLSFLLIAIVAAFPSAAAAQKIGERTGAPEQLFAGIGEGVSDAELDQAVAAAQAHPLGSLANPVRVGGPEGARAYLARLRCADGSSPKVGPRADGGVGAYGTVVDAYALDCGAAAPGRASVVMDIYHEEHVEKRAPPGFRIAG